MSDRKPSRDPDMLGRLWNDVTLALRLMLDRRVSGGAKFIPALVVLYILSPIDFLPDLLLPFGVMDDLGAFLLGLQLFIRSAPREVVDEYRAGRAPVAPGTARREGVPPHVIDGQFEVLDSQWDDYSDPYADDDDASARGQRINPPQRR